MSCVRSVVVVVLVALFGLAPASAAADRGEADVPLAEALEDWVRSLEQGDAESAAKWAGGPEAAKAQAQWWDQLKQCHKEYDYRAWLDRDPATGGPGARKIGDAGKFTVGGHSFGHLHVNWVKGKAGWRISGVWACR